MWDWKDVDERWSEIVGAPDFTVLQNALETMNVSRSHHYFLWTGSCLYRQFLTGKGIAINILRDKGEIATSFFRISMPGFDMAYSAIVYLPDPSEIDHNLGPFDLTVLAELVTLTAFPSDTRQGYF